MKKYSFEEGILRLEKINELIESDKVTLEEASNLYKEGKELYELLKKDLEEKELIITQLDSEGNKEE